MSDVETIRGPVFAAFRYQPERGPPRRVVFRRRSDGHFERSTDVWTGCRWRTEGREYVEDVAVEIQEDWPEVRA